MADWEKYLNYIQDQASYVCNRVVDKVSLEPEDIRQELLAAGWQAAVKADPGKSVKGYISRSIANQGKMLVRSANSQKGIFVRRIVNYDFNRLGGGRDER